MANFFQRLFGFEIQRPKEDEPAPSFAPQETDDGALVVSASGFHGTYIDIEGAARTEAELINRYREMSLHPEIDNAVDEITNGALCQNEEEVIVKVFTDDLESQKLKDVVNGEFEVIMKLLNFKHKFYDIFRRWYIDGRLYYHVIIDVKATKEGIKELRYVDPRKIRKVREIQKKRLAASPLETIPIQKNEYYVYNDRGFNYGARGSAPQTTGLRIAKDSVCHITSGLTDTNGTMVLSYLHKGIKALNQLRMLEDAVVIYRISRAPERRLWYIDVGQLPKAKAEQYVRDIMVKHKNRLVYDAATGTVRDDRKFQTMLEDYWLPRREGGRGTEVDTLPPGQNLGKLEDVEYFQKKLYNSLNVPISRLEIDQPAFFQGLETEISREELKFDKFIDRLRTRFAELFMKLLEKQLLLKGHVTPDEWKQIKEKIRFTFVKDSHFTEVKDQQVLQMRANVVALLQQSGLIGTAYSWDWVRKTLLKQDEKEIEEQDALIEQEQDQFQYLPPEEKAQQRQGEMEAEQAEQERQAEQPTEEEQSQQAEQAEMERKLEILKKKPNRTLQQEKEFKMLTQKLAAIKRTQG